MSLFLYHNNDLIQEVASVDEAEQIIAAAIRHGRKIWEPILGKSVVMDGNGHILKDHNHDAGPESKI